MTDTESEVADLTVTPLVAAAADAYMERQVTQAEALRHDHEYRLRNARTALVNSLKPLGRDIDPETVVASFVGDSLVTTASVELDGLRFVYPSGYASSYPSGRPSVERVCARCGDPVLVDFWDLASLGEALATEQTHERRCPSDPVPEPAARALTAADALLGALQAFIQENASDHDHDR